MQLQAYFRCNQGRFAVAWFCRGWVTVGVEGGGEGGLKKVTANVLKQDLQTKGYK